MTNVSLNNFKGHHNDVRVFKKKMSEQAAQAWRTSCKMNGLNGKVAEERS